MRLKRRGQGRMRNDGNIDGRFSDSAVSGLGVMKVL